MSNLFHFGTAQLLGRLDELAHRMHARAIRERDNRLSMDARQLQQLTNSLSAAVVREREFELERREGERRRQEKEEQAAFDAQRHSVEAMLQASNELSGISPEALRRKAKGES